MRIRALLTGLFFCFAALAVELKIPALRSPVMDVAEILTEAQRTDLSTLAYEIYTHNGPQITILTVPDLQDHSIEDFSIRVAEQWKLGLKEKGNGLLITVAVNERKMRIEVGEGIEGEITDFEANQYIQQLLTPAFRARDYHAGLRLVLEDVARKFSVTISDTSGPILKKTRPQAKAPLNAFILIGFIVLFLGNIFLRRHRMARGFVSGFGLVGTGLVFLPGVAIGMLILLFFVGLILGVAGFNNVLYALASGRGGHYGRGGGFGGGGGWSGGGGGFSGGGASGGW